MHVLGRPSSSAKGLRISLALALVIALLGFAMSPRNAIADTNEAALGSLNEPVQSSISLGWFHSCVIVSDGTVRCWGAENTGADYMGALGNGPAGTGNPPAPVTVSNLAGVKALAAGYHSTCALLTTGTVKCWGWNSSGQLGDGTSVDNTNAWNKDVPVDVKTSASDSTPLSGVTAIAAGTNHNCALLSDKTVKCWGLNGDGQLGNGYRTKSNVPVAVSGLTNVTAIAAGGSHTCALLADKTVSCWGDGEVGQLGHGEAPVNQANRTYADKLVPTSVAGLTDAVAISLGQAHSCALRSDKTARCWGYGYSGQLGTGEPALELVSGQTTYYYYPNKNVATPVAGLTSAIAISAGSYHTCALLENNTAQCWGKNATGQLGDDTITGRNAPGDVVATSGSSTPLTGVLAILAGHSHSCAVLSSSISCWGDNSWKQLGVGPTGGTDMKVPTPVVPANGDTITPVPPLDPPPPPPPSPPSPPSDNNSSSGGTTTDNTLSPGEYNATVNGQQVDVDITSSNDGHVTIDGPDFSLTFDSPTSGGNNELFLPQGGTVTFNGEGYKPNSNVTSTLTTTNTKLGENKVGRNGSSTSKLSVPRSTRTGNHQLSINGTTAKGSARSIVIGVKVAKLKKTTLKTFRVYSTKMRPKLRKQAKRIVKQNPTLTAVHCEGFVRPSKATNPKDIARATKRAKSACKYLKKRKKSIHTTIGVSPSNLNRRRVEVSYR